MVNTYSQRCIYMQFPGRVCKRGPGPGPAPPAAASLSPRNHSQLAVSQLSCKPRSAYSTLSIRGLGLYLRPTFATGFPSTSTTSAVKSNRPWYSDEPTP